MYGNIWTLSLLPLAIVIGFPPSGRALAVARVYVATILILPVPIRARYQIGITLWTLSINTIQQANSATIKDDKRRA